MLRDWHLHWTGVLRGPPPSVERLAKCTVSEGCYGECRFVAESVSTDYRMENVRSCGIGDLNMRVGERQVTARNLPFSRS